MYAGDWAVRLSQLVRQRRPSHAWRVPANVWGLGITSLLTDISSEMVISVLPAYLVLMSGAGPLALGIATGLHEGGPLLVTWLGGWIADHSGKRKLTAASGYALSALCRVGWLLLSGRAIAGLALLIVGDRIGKAIRAAPRDAMISLSAPPEQLATAFGVHRALDAVGAAIGPITAWILLWQFPQRYDVVFFASLVLAVLGVVAITLLVHESPEWRSSRAEWRHVWTGALGVFTHASLRRVLIVSTALGLVTIRDAFVYLLLVQRADIGAQWIPLFYSGTAVSFLLLAVPAGRVADRVGRERVFILGHVFLLGAYAIVMTGAAPWPWSAIVSVLLLGAYYAASDGVLASLAGGLLPAHARSLGLAWVATGVSVSRLCSAIVFGLLWTRYGDLVAVTTFTTLLVIVVAAAWLSARDMERVIS